MSICSERWFQIIERLSRPLSRWFFAAAAIAYGFRPVIDYSFNEATFLALCVPAGFTYGTRAVEKIKELEIEQAAPFLGKGQAR